MFSSVPTAGAWFDDDDAALMKWYADYETWSRTREQPFELEALRERLWSVAASGSPVPAGQIMARFHLARGDGLRGIGYVLGVVSEHNRRILSHQDVYLESFVYQKRTGLPLSGYFNGTRPSPGEIAELDDDRKRTHTYCKTHSFKSP